MKPNIFIFNRPLARLLKPAPRHARMGLIPSPSDFSSNQIKQNIDQINKTSPKLACEGLAKVCLGGLGDLKQTLR